VMAMRAWFCVSYIRVIKPQMDDFVSINETLCGGRQNLVYALDPNYLLYASPSNPLDKNVAEITSSTQALMREMINTPMNLSNTMTLWFMNSPVDNVAKVASWDMLQAAEGLQEYHGAKCDDLLYSMPGTVRFLNEVKHSHGDQCSVDFKCRSLSLECCSEPFFKMVCPETCGCDSPKGTTLLTWAGDGCPPGCMEGQVWNTAVSHLPCKDPPQEEFSTTLWSNWGKDFERKVMEVYTLTSGNASEALVMCGGNCTAFFMQQGCNIIHTWRALSYRYDNITRDPCKGEWSGNHFRSRPMSMVCPETCQCHTGSPPIGVVCPGTCSNR